ncbi:sensor domain-containing protein [Streptomyces sp. NBC_00536]|uniref:sensor histidine kinase n=1 Tax=Streptomyces sp. NBC_00536 TaxID=2975769 RepID=UPI002E7FDA8D|nr:sensor domain-containing protein [Streptomyces sp. NBC_00536]WUC80537.1 sensor domain-containing protein [Streptomyces sp. NBC_00536]
MSSVITRPRTAFARGLTALGRCQLAGLLAAAVPVVGAGVVGVLLLLPVGLGHRMLPPAAAGLRRCADRARARAEGWSGLRTGPPDPLPRTAGARAVLAAEGFWRDLAWAWLEPLVGGALVAVPSALVVYGVFGALVQPFVWRLLDDGNWYAFIPVRSTTTMVAALVLGLVLTAAGLLLAPSVLRLHARWTRRLLAAPQRAELARRVEWLTDTRADALDDRAAELRRIERDLHDGAQARIVALGMRLDSAVRLLERDPEGARALLLEVRQLSGRALEDLRGLVRGIQPSVLTDRGLGDALRSLALDSFLDVHVEARPAGRLPAAVESAAYFAVNELLANAAKHSGADRVDIVVTHLGDTDTDTDSGNMVRVTVTDDGCGGADPSRGTGLLGIRRRLAAFDGSLALHSPQGGPTTATLEIPCASSSPKTSSC